MLFGLFNLLFDVFGWECGVLNVINPKGLFYFALGCYFAQHPIRVARRPGLGWLCIAVAFGLAGLRAAIIHGELMRGDLIGCIMVPIALIGLWMALPDMRVADSIRNSTMAIYLSHTLIAMIFFDVLRIIWPLSARPNGADMWFQTLGVQILLVVFQVMVALFLARLVGRSKLFNAILFGGRC